MAAIPRREGESRAAELSSFFAEVEQLTEQVEAEEAQTIEAEGAQLEDEESVLQMAYSVKLAALMHRADQSLTKTGATNHAFANIEDEAEAIGELIKVDPTGSQRISNRSSSVVDQVEDIMRQRKRRRPQLSSNTQSNATATVNNTKRQKVSSSPQVEEKKSDSADNSEDSSNEEEEDDYDPLAFL